MHYLFSSLSVELKPKLEIDVERELEVEVEVEHPVRPLPGKIKDNNFTLNDAERGPFSGISRPALFSYPYSSSIQWSPFKDPVTNESHIVGQRGVGGGGGGGGTGSKQRRITPPHHEKKSVEVVRRVAEKRRNVEVEVGGGSREVRTDRQGDRDRQGQGEIEGQRQGREGEGGGVGGGVAVVEREGEGGGQGGGWNGEAPVRLTALSFMQEARAEAKYKRRCSIPSNQFSSFDVVRKKSG